MSLPTDIIQLFGPKSAPVIVFVSVLGVFELGERLASQRLKDALSKWLLTFDVKKAGVLPDGTQELFEKIFGERHFSVKCFVRSAVFSVGAMAFVALLVFLMYPKEFFKMVREFLWVDPEKMAESYQPLYGTWLWFALWVPWSVLVDYVSLLKTRLILRFLTQIRRRIVLVAVTILAIDYIAYQLIFFIGALLVTLAFQGFGTSVTKTLLLFIPIIVEANIRSLSIGRLLAPPENTVLSIFFWGGLAPSIWMWLYILALFVTRGLLRSERIVSWPRWALDIEKTPFRSIGAVAATLAFIASVAVILVSAEVARISDA